ncbi:hypothetical protein CPB84DRAFT_1966488 [Gymnopilus junonius]|uniref:Uncharacterized protein n=1 Tax=Gymnopilus junonius TaxID=109634 RepID=A0A9P5NB30_GYMJU|nr:hypothetical protein CPB84DRAFT_1966488 [Gymnopilus junonius]
MTYDPPIANLSQELIDNIIDHIAADSQPGCTGFLGGNLQQCALVSRSFRPRSQLQIFSFIHIRGDPSSKRQHIVQNLLQIIHDHPDIAHYIEELSLECTDLEPSWMYEDPSFLSILECISTSGKPLRKLTMIADTRADDGFETLPLEDTGRLLNTFFLPFIAPFITTLSLHRLLNVPIEMVESCVNVTELELLEVEFEEWPDSRHQKLPSAQLQRLAYQLGQGAMSKLLNIVPDGGNSFNAIDVSQLKSLIIYTDILSDLKCEQKIIDLSIDALEELQLLTTRTACNGRFHASVDLRHSTRLRRLHAHVLFPQDRLVSILRTLSSVRSFSLGSLVVEAKVAYCDLSEPEVLLDADWVAFSSEVGRVMAEGSRFEIKMTYLYRKKAAINLYEYEALLQTRCESVMVELRREKINSLENYSHFTCKLSHALEFGTLFEFDTSPYGRD